MFKFFQKKKKSAGFRYTHMYVQQQFGIVG